MADVWVFTASGYYRVDADTMVRSSLFPHPSGAPLVQSGFRPITDGTYVYATSTGTDVFYRVAKATGTYERVAVGDQPRMSADDGTSLWVGNDADNTVSRVSKASMTVTSTVSIANNGQLLWVDPYLWVVNSGASPTGAVIRVYDPVSGTVVQTITLTTATADVQDLAYYDGHVYVPVRFVDRLHKVSTSTFTSVANVALTEGARVRVVGGELLVVGGDVPGSADVIKVNPADLSTVATLAGSYTSLAASDGVDTMFVITGTTLHRVDVPTMTVTGTTLIGVTPTGMVYDELPPVVSAAGWGIDTINW